MPVETVTVRKAGRLDKMLAGLLADTSRSAVQRLIELERVTVNGAVQSASHQVKPGDVVIVDIPEAASATTLPEDIALKIIYEDDDVIAVDKAAGMVVHPGAGNSVGTLANAILAREPGIASVGDPARPGIVHRLDKESSGIVLLAKNQDAYIALQKQFKARAIKKLYMALCVGAVSPPRGVINKPIGRDPAHRQRMAIVADGRESVSHYAVAEVYKVNEALTPIDYPGLKIPKSATYSYVRVRPSTGRTHQIRVHLASIGFPIVGDELYGATRGDALSRALAPRHLLHAGEISFESPSSGQTVTLYAPLPEDMRRVLTLLGD